jgi:RNA polymerase primary sigma factor
LYAFRVTRRQATNGREGTSSTLSAYLREIAKIPRLTIDEERELGARIQQNREDAALTRLVEANLRFVVSYARRYRGLGVSSLDLIHGGNLGLIEAARRFDPSRNVKFITYAVWWVRESMMHVLAEETRAFSFPPKLFARLHEGGDFSLSALVGSDGQGCELAELLAAGDVATIDEEMIHRSEIDDLAQAMLQLDRNEREIVRLRFGFGDDEPRTLQEIGNRLHLSRERVRQIESRAKDKLRRSAKLRSRLN